MIDLQVQNNEKLCDVLCEWLQRVRGVVDEQAKASQTLKIQLNLLHEHNRQITDVGLIMF